jgi:hypothetical protein
MLAAISRRVRALTRRSGASVPRIRRYKAACFDLRMSVHRTGGGWTVRVHDSDENTLYSAIRDSLDAAKLVAVEFAVLRMTGALEAGTVQILAQNLPWDEA